MAYKCTRPRDSAFYMPYSPRPYVLTTKYAPYSCQLNELETHTNLIEVSRLLGIHQFVSQRPTYSERDNSAHYRKLFACDSKQLTTSDRPLLIWRWQLQWLSSYRAHESHYRPVHQWAGRGLLTQSLLSQRVIVWRMRERGEGGAVELIVI